jgi:hypothetical protein
MISADEKFVRANWEHVRSWVRDLDSYGTDQFNVALFFNEKDARWCDNPFKEWQMDVGKEKVVWKLAAEFTRNRLEEIRQVEAEIVLVDYDGKGGPDWNDLINGRIGKEFGLSVSVAQQKIRWCRILVRLQAALAELKKGMR